MVTSSVEDLNFFDCLPFPGWVLVKPDEQVRQTQSGLVIPSSAQKRNSSGHVVAVGDMPPDWVGTIPYVGDYVFWLRHAGVGLERDGVTEWVFIKFADIIVHFAEKDIPSDLVREALDVAVS